MSTLDFDRSVRAPDAVVIRELEGESVLLNLESEMYFGLDRVGTRMWTVLTESPSIQVAYETLLAEFEVTPEVLRRDLETLLGQLLEQRLVEQQDEAPGQ